MNVVYDCVITECSFADYEHMSGVDAEKKQPVAPIYPEAGERRLLSGITQCSF